VFSLAVDDSQELDDVHGEYGMYYVYYPHTTLNYVNIMISFHSRSS
jgi:hypothetical protein